MIESKHTPGPWHQNEQTGAIYAADGFEVCDTFSEPYTSEKWALNPKNHWSDNPGVDYIERSGEEAQANAELIASAPALLQEVEKLRKENNGLREVLAMLIDCCDGNYEESVLMAKEALTK